MKHDIKSLKESSDFLMMVIDNMTSALFIVDSDIRVRDFNDSFQAVFNKPEEKIIGELCGNALGCFFAVDEDSFCGQTSHCTTCRIRDYLLKIFDKKEPTYRKKIVRKFWIQEKYLKKCFQFSVIPVHFDGELMSLVIVDDVTEIENQRYELSKLNALKNKFLGMAAHDLRNPISVIMNNSELLLMSQNNLDEEDVEILHDIHKSTKRMSKLIADLLDVSVIESGSFKLAKSDNNLNDLLCECVENQKLKADKKSILLKTSLTELEETLFDRNHIGQVIDNIIDNAIKYSPHNTTVTISSFSDDTTFGFSITDEGPGFTDDDKVKMFREFQRLSAKPTGEEKSTGLGLMIVKNIVDGHSGRISVESEYGSGATITVSLPKNSEESANG